MTDILRYFGIFDGYFRQGWGLPDWSAREYPTESETRADTSGAWATTSSLDLGYMEEEPTIACSWQDETWRRMALFGLAAFIGYTLMIPGTLGLGAPIVVSFLFNWDVFF